MMIDYGKELKARRRALGPSQGDVADKAYCHRTIVCKAEHSGSITLGVFLSILAALGLKMEIVEDERFNADNLTGNND